MGRYQVSIQHYQPSFKVSERRTVYQRFTPLTWFCVVLGGLGVVATLITVINLRITALNGTQSLFDQPGDGSAQQASAPVVANAPAARPTARPAAIVFEVNPAVQTSQSGVQNPAGNSSASSTSANVAGQSNTGAGQAQDASAEFQAQTQAVGKPVVKSAAVYANGNQIALHVKQYYAAMKEMPLNSYLAKRDTMLPLYFGGPGLNAAHDEEAKRSTYSVFKAGDVDVEVLEVSGRVGKIKVVRKDWVSDVYNAKTGALKQGGVKYDLIEQEFKVVYDAVDNRWKFVDGLVL